MAKITGLQAANIAANFKATIESKGYKFFSKGDYNINIIGVRNHSGKADKFDDFMNVIYRKDAAWVVDTYVITTEPGTSVLQRPIVGGGTAILVPNQYSGVYKIDTHGGKRKYTALCQRSGTVDVWRDDNRDRKPDYTGAIHTGMFGINIHRQWGSDEREYTGGVSAGCQVFQSSKDFYEFMDTCNKSADRYGNSFTYTLLNEEDLGMCLV